MSKYRKKAVIIDAEHWDGTAETADAIVDWINVGRGLDAIYYPELRAAEDEPEDSDYLTEAELAEPVIAIRTLEGTMYASAGDWIIEGVQGEFYPCKPDIFEATYEQVDA